MRARVDDFRRDGLKICVVPTMGFLHEGHLSLLREGRARADILILTLFVNPTQFGPNEDLDRYPRDEAGDIAKARECGIDLAFCPGPNGMYSDGYQTFVSVRDLQKPLCGAKRPGHFDGVSSVVTKLFNITKPHVAVFGQKDFQQLALIRRMVVDLDFGIEIVGMPIVREPDGLALSSRNKYLSDEEREQCLAHSQGLTTARALYEGGERTAATLVTAVTDRIAEAPLAKLDYAELRDAATLELVDTVAGPAVIAVAVFYGATRLIDNIVLD
jgi:pantoate--beta-alanine ligase